MTEHRDLWCVESMDTEVDSVNEWILDYCASEHFEEVITRLFQTEEDAQTMCDHGHSLFPHLNFRPRKCFLMILGDESSEQIATLTKERDSWRRTLEKMTQERDVAMATLIPREKGEVYEENTDLRATMRGITKGIHERGRGPNNGWIVDLIVLALAPHPKEKTDAS